MSYCPNFFQYQRRLTRVVSVGNVQIGGHHPIRVQSMLTSDTRDAEACIQEALGLAAAGCEIIRITAQTKIIAQNLEVIKAGLLRAGCEVPIVADIHFKPDAAMEAVKWVEKVRINPGNFIDKKKFDVREYSDSQYAEELEKIEEAFIPLVEECKKLGRAMRIGTNHGSLSDRIMNRYGDTPLGMVESALEFARIARQQGFHNFLFSMKSSNPKVMIEAYRLLIHHLNLQGEDWNYPIHLGVTEAGDGEDGRIKSAIGIGALLADGIGDTVRVSLTEDAIHEIPVCQKLVKRYNQRLTQEIKVAHKNESPKLSYNIFEYQRRATATLQHEGICFGGDQVPAVVISQKGWDSLAHKFDKLGDYKPDIGREKIEVVEVNPFDEDEVRQLNLRKEPVLVAVKDGLDIEPIAAYRWLAAKLSGQHPFLLKDTLNPNIDIAEDSVENLLVAATQLGALLCDGLGDAVWVRLEEAPGQSMRVAYNILQATGTRIFKTDYVACPSCGRTLFNLQSTTQKIREATGHLKGVRIAVMGCIVNGPGEMADADFGYVGGAPGKINLYVKKTAVKFNIPEEQAVTQLVDLIKSHGRWFEPVAQ
jgi:(E)-4-hydroxy-3-methylbut-2-enyl-diphosphate synthase